MKKFLKNKWVILLSFLFNLLFLSLCLFWIGKYPTKFINVIFPGRTINVVMLGNSLTEGTDWTKQLRRSDVYNSGHGGFLTLQILRNIRNFTLAYKPKICFIEGGINDICFGIPVGETFKNFQSIIDSLKANNITPVLSLTLYQYNEDKTKDKIDSLNTLIKMYAIENDIEFFDLNEKLSEDRSIIKKYTTDGTHLTKEAYPLWTLEVKKILVAHKLD